MSDKLGNFIRERRGDVSLRDFAKQCNISHTHLDSIEKGVDPRTGKPVRVTTETLKNLADGIGCDFLELAALAENMDYMSGSNAPLWNAAEKASFLKQAEEDYESGKRTLDDELSDFDYALHGEAKHLDDEQKQELLRIAKFLRGQKKKDEEQADKTV